jgi:hypothetical protein
MSRPLPPSTMVVATGYLIYAIAGVLCASYEVLLVPTRWGSTLLPIAPVLAIASNVALPRFSRQLTGTVRSALPPVVGWLLAAFVLASTRPEGDVLLPAGDTAWVSYGVLFGGALAGLLTLAFAGRGRLLLRPPTNPPSDQPPTQPSDQPPTQPSDQPPSRSSDRPRSSGSGRPLPRPRHGPARSGSGSGDAR